MESSELIDLLHRLEANCRACERCHRRGADQARNDELVDILARRAGELAVAASELRACAAAVEATADPPWADAARTDPLASVAPAGDAALLDACERAEDAALTDYLAALDRPLDAPLHAVVQRQYDNAKHHHGTIRTLRDQARAANA